MWPYNKHHFDKGPGGKCHRCGKPSTGYYEYGKLVMSGLCPECKEKDRKEFLKELKDNAHKD